MLPALGRLEDVVDEVDDMMADLEKLVAGLQKRITELERLNSELNRKWHEDRSELERVRGKLADTCIMVREELVFGGDWDAARGAIDRALAEVGR